MYRILLVDDEILVRDAIRENIDWQSMDCELVGDCENGQAAAEFVKQHEVDIVLTDICMPYMDGMELSHFLHDNYPDIVIVIFSGFNDFEYAKKAIQYNVSEYMLKPITAMELTEVIEKMKEKVKQKKSEKQKIENLRDTSEKYRENALMIRSKELESLVNCTKDVNKSLEQLRNMGIILENCSSYRVVVLDIDLYSDLYQIDMEKQQESALMAFVLFNISDEIINREAAGVVYQEGSNHVCLLFMGERNLEFSKKIQQICREIQQKVKEVIGIEVSVGIGNWVRKPEELIFSHKQAEKAMCYRYLLGGNLLIDMEDQKDQPILSIQEQIEELENAIKLGNKEKMAIAFSKMEQNIKDSFADKNRANFYLQQMTLAIYNVYENMNLQSDGNIAETQEILLKVMEQNSFQKALRIVKEYAQRVFDEMQELNSSNGKRQAIRAMDYIQNNYKNPSLGLNDICSYLNISTSHFSTIFKEVTGETFIEALIRVRMERAKELLEKTTMKNYEIAEQVGFSDSHYFGISFKKMTGKTPTEYAREKRR